MAVKRPVLRWHGGKWLLADWVIGFFPPHHVYVEPFGGAASVLLKKPRCHSEIYNDLDKDVVNLFRVLRDERAAAELARLLRLTPFDSEEFAAAYEPGGSAVERARKLVVRSYMGFGSDSHNAATATGFRSNGTRGGASPGADWANYPAALAAVVDRLRGVMVHNHDGVQIMRRFDLPDALHYVDPPYLHSTRSEQRGVYAHEMTDVDHEMLASCLHELQGCVVLSGYRSPLYDRLYRGWESHDRAHKTNRKADRIETVWLNPRAAASQQGQLL